MATNPPLDEDNQLVQLEIDKIKSERWPLKYGSGILASLGVASGTFINEHYRKIFRMGKAFRITTWVPVAIAPPLLGGIIHAGQINSLIIHSKERFECPVCYQMRVGAFQTFCATIYPIVSGFVFCGYLTKRHKPDNFYKLDLGKSVTKDFIKVLPKTHGLTLMLISFIVGMFMAQFELQAVIDTLKEESDKKNKI